MSAVDRAGLLPARPRAKGSPRRRSCSGGWRSATLSRSTRSSSRWRPPRPSSTCPARTRAGWWPCTARPGQSRPVGQPLISVGPPTGAARAGGAARDVPRGGAGRLRQRPHRLRHRPRRRRPAAPPRAPAVVGGPEPDGRRPGPGAAPAPARSPPAAAAVAAADVARAPALVISPIVRRLAREHGLDLAALRGSGPGGMVRRADVEAALAVAAARAVAARRRRRRRRRAGRTRHPAHRRPPGDRGEALAQPPGDSGGDHLGRCGRHRAAGDPRRDQRRPARPAGERPGAAGPDLPARAGAIPASSTPTSTPRGSGSSSPPRCTWASPPRPTRAAGAGDPRRAASRRRELAARLRETTAAARAGRLTPDRLTGGTFTLNNYGVFGVDGSTPIINHPEAALLGIGRIVPSRGSSTTSWPYGGSRS